MYHMIMVVNNKQRGCKMKKLGLVCLMCICFLWVVMPQMVMAEKASGVLQEAVERGTLRVGMSSFIPWAMQDKTGKYIGFEVDVATRLANDFGLELELLPTKWSGIIPALLTGKFDIIVSGLSVTPDRSLRVNFSDPYDHTVIEAVGRKDQLGEHNSFETLNKPETIVAVRTGTTAAKAAKLVLPNATMRYFDEEAPAVQEMLSGRAHVLFGSSPLGSFEVVRSPELVRHVTDEIIFPQPISIAVRKGDYDTINALNAWIRSVEGEGWLKERRDYWFKTRQWEELLK